MRMFKRINLSLETSKLTVLIELSWWRKIYPSKATLLLPWSHRYKNYMVVIMNRLTVTKYQISNLMTMDRFRFP